MVSQGMEMVFPGEHYDKDYLLGKPDLAKVAEGLGAEAIVVNKPADLTTAWPKVVSGAKNGRPQVILAMIDRTAAPPYWSPPYWQKNLVD
jgi:acetolactate synthase-1/2/3 large subunit